MPMTPEEQAQFDAFKAKAEKADALKADNDKLMADLDKATKPNKETPEPKKENETLNEKVAREAKEKADKEASSKDLEVALTFNLTSDAFLKENEAVLPKEMSEIFAAAGKEKYDSPIDKANATKTAIIQSFFSVQANLDLTTPAHKQAVEDYFKLTKKGKEEKAAEMFRNVFEPALEMAKRLRKAEEVGKANSGYSTPSDSDKAYRDRMIAGSRKHFLGEK